MKLQRRLDWRSRLRAFADAQVGSSFQWGATDCASIARQALIEMFGEAIEGRLPHWDSQLGAYRVLKHAGSVGSLLEGLGAELTSVAFLRAGDILIDDNPEEEVGGVSVLVCIDTRECLASTRDGVVWSLPPEKAEVYSLWEVSEEVHDG